jgi:hypothetical protein
MWAMADGKNLIWDITMSSPASAGTRIDQLRDAGYDRIEAIFVDIPIEVSIERATARHRAGHDQYLAGAGLGGRYIGAEDDRRPGRSCSWHRRPADPMPADWMPENRVRRTGQRGRRRLAAGDRAGPVGRIDDAPGEPARGQAKEERA